MPDIKPMLACDWDESRQRWPAIAQPKTDGVRGLNMSGVAIGRSMRPHSNVYTREFYSLARFAGLDGELAAAHECDPALCRKTVSALNTITGEPFTLWWLFDYVTPETVALPYFQRRVMLVDRVARMQDEGWPAAQHLRTVPSVVVGSLEEFLELEDHWLALGYEGGMLRDPQGRHKAGRCTVAEGLLLRVKRFVEEDAVVRVLVEGNTNGNEATVNALGRTERSTHAENMTPNGMVGSLVCYTKDNKEITVSAGSMPHEDRVRYLQNPSLLLGKTIKYKHFPKGAKDKPRFPTFVSLRMESDK